MLFNPQANVVSAPSPRLHNEHLLLFDSRFIIAAHLREQFKLCVQFSFHLLTEVEFSFFTSFFLNIETYLQVKICG